MPCLYHLFSSKFARTLLGLITGMCLALTSFSIPAQDEMSEAEEDNGESKSTATVTTIPEVVVSASRVPIPPKHIGSTVSVLTAEEIEKRQTDYVHELLREIPSVAVSQTGAHSGIAQVRIRGAEGNHTLVLIDGLDMLNPLSGGEFHFQHLPTVPFKSIEILRGPQSSIHGSESIGGVISLTTAIPEQGTEASIGAEFGTLKSRKVNAYIGTANEDYFSTITASHNETEGVSASTNNEERDGFKSQYLHFKTGLQAGENIDLSTTLIGIKSASEYDDCGTWPNLTNNCLGKDKKVLFGTTVKINEDDDTLFHRLSFSKSQHDRKDFADGEQTTSSRGEKSKLAYQGTLNYQTQRALHSTTFAAEQQTSKVKSTSLYQPDGSIKLRSYILEQRLNFDDIGFYSASARYDDNRSNPFDSQTTYRLSGAWIIDNHIRLHSSYGTGVKNPTVSEIYGWSGSWRPSPTLKPETSKGWDLGIEAQLGGGRITVDATYFNNKIENMLGNQCVSGCGRDDDTNQPKNPSDPDPDGTTVSQSINEPGESRIRGLELSASGELGTGYEVSAHWTHSDGVDANKRNLVRRPRRTASLNVNKNLSLFNRPANVNLNIQHTGLQFDWDYSRLPGFTIANLAATFDISPNSQVTARIKNLFNKTDYAEVGGYGVAERSFHIGVKYEF